MQPLFILLDLDDTLVDGRSRELLGGVRDYLHGLKSTGHYLSVCSNNVLAQEILAHHDILEMFDYVVSRCSTSRKSLEILECIEHYRYLYRTKAIRWKPHVNRVVFIDNDEENLCEIKERFGSVQTYGSVAMFVDGLSNWRKPPTVSLSDASQRVFGEYGVPGPWVHKTFSGGNAMVPMSAIARRGDNAIGVKDMKYHCRLPS